VAPNKVSQTTKEHSTENTEKSATYRLPNVQIVHTIRRSLSAKRGDLLSRRVDAYVETFARLLLTSCALGSRATEGNRASEFLALPFEKFAGRSLGVWTTPKLFALICSFLDRSEHRRQIALTVLPWSLKKVLSKFVSELCSGSPETRTASSVRDLFAGMNGGFGVRPRFPISSRGGSSAHSKKSQLSACPHRRNGRPLFTDSFLTMSSTEGLPQ
jgi:hypothetical protein